MRVKQGLICTLLVCFGANLVPARVWAETRSLAEAVAAAPADAAAMEMAAAAPVFNVEAAVRDAVARLEAPAVPLPAELAPSTASPARAATAAAARKKQGGSAGMIIGLVSLVAGLGMTYYMVKQMNKSDDDQ